MKAGWQTKPLSEVCTLQRGFDLPTHDRKKGRFPLVSSSGISDTHDEGPIAGPGVVTGRSGSIGNVFYVEDAFWPLNTTLYVRDFHGNLPRFVYHFLVAFDLKKYSGGTGVPTLNRNDVHGIQVTVPNELAEQHRIVTLLDEAFAGIATAKANAEKNLQNARDLFASHLQAIFSRYKEGWTVRTVRQLVSEGILAKPQDGNHGEIHPTKADYVDDGVPFIMAADLANGVVDTENCRFISEKQACTLRIGFAKSGDVLLSHKGTIGRVANLATNDDFIVLTPQVTYYRSLNGQRLNNGFLYYCLLSPVFQTEMNRIADSGSTRAYIGITRQLDLQISLPSINVQHELVARLRNIQENAARLESIYQNKITALDELKKSLLHRAFTGHLT
jgi:type I restriction enzyme S subunit